MRRIFAPYLDPDQSTKRPSNFSVRRPAGVLRRRQAELHVAGTLAHRDRHLGGVLTELIAYVSSLASARPTVTRLPLRTFVRGQRAVLVALDRPALVDDAKLAESGIVELPSYEALVDTSEGAVIVAAPLPGLAETAGIPTGPRSDRLELIGVVVAPNADGRREAAEFLRMTDDEGWLDLLVDFKRSGVLRMRANESDVRTTLMDMLADRTLPVSRHSQ